MKLPPDVEEFDVGEWDDSPLSAMRIPVKNSEAPCILYSAYAEPLLEAAARAHLAWTLNKDSVCLAESLGKEDMRGQIRLRSDVSRIIALHVPDLHSQVTFVDGNKLNLLRPNLRLMTSRKGGKRHRWTFALEVGIRIAVVESSDKAGVNFAMDLIERLAVADALTPPLAPRRRK